MKVHLVQVMVIDFDDLGHEEVCNVIEDTRYPNDCINPEVISTTTVDIGEWSDDHPLNKKDKWFEEACKLFHIIH